MKRHIIALLSFTLWLFSAVEKTPGQGQSDDPILSALEIEVKRAMTGLAERSERPPYFLGYEVWERWTDRLFARYGAIVTNQSERKRLLGVDVRVGTYRFDNTHRAWGRRIGTTNLPLDDDEDALRAVIWLETEKKYRQAADRYILAEAGQATMLAPQDTSPDFSREEPHILIEEIPQPLLLKRAEWAGRLRRLSARFHGHPLIHTSSVTLGTKREVRYIVNSEGTRVRSGDTWVRLTIRVGTRADDGMDLFLSRAFEAFTLGGLPSEGMMASAIEKLISEIETLRSVPVVEPYVGPAILSGKASAVFFHETLGHRLEGHRQKDEKFAQTFTKKIGEMILPSYITVSDDPTRRTFEGTDLSGHYRVDDEGIPARHLPLVKSGLLSGFLMCRSPIEAARRSNGHGRRMPGYGIVSRQGNLFVESQRTISPTELRAQLLEEVERQGKPYGLYFDEIQGGFTFTRRNLPQSFKIIPVKVYRVYPDGRPDELVRGVNIVGTPLTVLGKILATDDRTEVFNGMCRAESGSLPISAVAPGILVSEIEIEKKVKSMRRQPVLPPPSGQSSLAKRMRRQGKAGGDLLLQALTDELARSADSLNLEGLSEPYYLSYRVQDGVTFQVAATFGAVVLQDLKRARTLWTDIRVGSRQDDNSNLSPTGFGFRSPRSVTVSLPIDDHYGAIRRDLWRQTDDEYKGSVRELGMKRARVEGRAEIDTVPDFSVDPPHVLIKPVIELQIDQERWAKIARRTSAIFREYPSVQDARVVVRVNKRNRYFVSSEGSLSRVPEAYYTLEIFATAREEKGLAVSDFRRFAAASPRALPGLKVLVQSARELAEKVTAIAGAKTLESYIGPVLFEDRAAAQFFYSLLGRHLSGTPQATTTAGLSMFFAGDKPLERRLGRRVLPRGFTVVDDPTLANYKGSPLIGHYLVDDEGMPPKRVVAVEDGILKAFLMSRTPSKWFSHSTGHGRTGLMTNEHRATVGNLIVKVDKGLNSAELRSELLSLASEMGLEYGVVITGLSNELIFPILTQMVSFSGRGTRRQPELPPPLAAFKVYPDGRQEPIRGIEFVDVTVRALRDIVASGKSAVVYPLLSVVVGRGSPTFSLTLASVSAPAVLVREVELRKSETMQKPPVLNHPYFDH